jgi:hypothetical protein
MDTNKSSRSILKKVTVFLLFTFIFSFVYTQSPLFTSNQNQYFLHGMAQAGIGSLNGDWLANTLDPTPVFSFLVKWTYLVFGIKELFYVYYALLMGLYLISLWGILDICFRIGSSKTKTLLTLGLIILIHSAALRFILASTLGDNWAFLLDGGLAGQRTLGLVFQPSTFGVLLVFSFYLFIKNKPYWATGMVALASTIHPTYLLSAAALTSGYMLSIFAVEKNLKKSILIGLEAFLLVIPILVYVTNSFGSSQTQAQANEILVNFNIPYHTLISEWFDLTSVIKIAIITLGIWLVRKENRFFIPLTVSAIIAIFLTLIQVVTQNQMLALIFPWRLSIYLVPICACILITKGIVIMLNHNFFENKSIQQFMQVFSLGLIAVLILVGITRTQLDFERQATEPEQPMLNWVRNNSTNQDMYLIDPQIKDFRLTTLRPIYADLLATPYAGNDVLIWYKRVNAELKLIDTKNCYEIVYIQHDSYITHVVLDKNRSNLNCSQLKTVFEDKNYVVYQINN